MIQKIFMIQRDVFPLISKISSKAFMPLSNQEIKGNTKENSGKHLP